MLGWYFDAEENICYFSQVNLVSDRLESKPNAYSGSKLCQPFVDPENEWINPSNTLSFVKGFDTPKTFTEAENICQETTVTTYVGEVHAGMASFEFGFVFGYLWSRLPENTVFWIPYEKSGESAIAPKSSAVNSDSMRYSNRESFKYYTDFLSFLLI